MKIKKNFLLDFFTLFGISGNSSVGNLLSKEVFKSSNNG
jgi:hypothetical protein